MRHQIGTRVGAFPLSAVYPLLIVVPGAAMLQVVGVRDTGGALTGLLLGLLGMYCIASLTTWLFTAIAEKLLATLGSVASGREPAAPSTATNPTGA